MEERKPRVEAIGFLTYEGDRLPVVNISDTGALISCDPGLFVAGQSFATRVEIRNRGERSDFAATATVVRLEEGRVGVTLERED